MLKQVQQNKSTAGNGVCKKACRRPERRSQIINDGDILRSLGFIWQVFVSAGSEKLSRCYSKTCCICLIDLMGMTRNTFNGEN